MQPGLFRQPLDRLSRLSFNTVCASLENGMLAWRGTAAAAQRRTRHKQRQTCWADSPLGEVSRDTNSIARRHPSFVKRGRPSPSSSPSPLLHRTGPEEAWSSLPECSCRSSSLPSLRASAHSIRTFHFQKKRKRPHQERPYRISLVFDRSNNTTNYASLIPKTTEDGRVACETDGSTM